MSLRCFWKGGTSVASLSSLPEPRAAPARGGQSSHPSREPDLRPLGTTVQARVSAVHTQHAAWQQCPGVPHPGNVASSEFAGQNRCVSRLGFAPNTLHISYHCMQAKSPDGNSPSNFSPTLAPAMKSGGSRKSRNRWHLHANPWAERLTFARHEVLVVDIEADVEQHFLEFAFANFNVWIIGAEEFSEHAQ